MAQNEPGGERLGAKASNSAGREKGEERTDLRGVDIATLGDCWSTEGGEWREAADEREESRLRSLSGWWEGERHGGKEGRLLRPENQDLQVTVLLPSELLLRASLLFSYIKQNVNSHPNSISSQYGEGTDL